ncbi:hypothetical protein B0H13DRAFT_2122158, partial [Mycena leptocephala]
MDPKARIRSLRLRLRYLESQPNKPEYFGAIVLHLVLSYALTVYPRLSHADSSISVKGEAKRLSRVKKSSLVERTVCALTKRKCAPSVARLGVRYWVYSARRGAAGKGSSNNCPERSHKKQNRPPTTSFRLPRDACLDVPNFLQREHVRAARREVRFY